MILANIYQKNVYHLLGTNVNFTYINSLKPSMEYPCLTDEQTGQRGEVGCPKSRSSKW